MRHEVKDGTLGRSIPAGGSQRTGSIWQAIVIQCRIFPYFLINLAVYFYPARMKTLIPVCFLFAVLLAIGCGQSKQPKQSPEKLTKAQVASAVKEYFMRKLRNPVAGENEGLYRIQGDQEICLFSLDKIFIGQLDSNNTEDAIVTYGYEKTDQMAIDRHLILLHDSTLHVVKDFPYAMTVRGINSRMVVAVVDTGKKDLNAIPCSACQELQQLKLVNDSLVVVK